MLDKSRRQPTLLYQFIQERHETQTYLYPDQIYTIRKIFDEFLARHLLAGDIIQLPRNLGIIYLTRSKNPLHRMKYRKAARLLHLKYKHYMTDGYFFRFMWVLRGIPGEGKNIFKAIPSYTLKRNMANMINNGKLYPYITQASAYNMVQKKLKKLNDDEIYQAYKY